MPMEGLNPRPNFQEEMRQARNAEEALLAVLNACARVTREISDINWNSPEAFGSWISRLQGQRSENKIVLALECLSFLNLKECVISLLLVRANLKKVNLSNAILDHIYMQEVYLQEADLSGVDFNKAVLKEVYLQKADVSGADFNRAILQDVHFHQSILEGTVFKDLDTANLSESANEDNDKS